VPIVRIENELEGSSRGIFLEILKKITITTLRIAVIAAEIGPSTF
jgi:hypothetical protein